MNTNFNSLWFDPTVNLSQPINDMFPLKVKEEMSGTSNAVQQLQSTTVSVMKHKEKYHQCCIDTERLKRISAAPKEIEKVSIFMRLLKNNTYFLVNFLIQFFSNYIAKFYPKVFTSIFGGWKMGQMTGVQNH